KTFIQVLSLPWAEFHTSECRFQIRELPCAVDSVATILAKLTNEIPSAHAWSSGQPNRVCPVRMDIVRRHMLRDKPVVTFYNLSERSGGSLPCAHQFFESLQ